MSDEHNVFIDRMLDEKVKAAEKINEMNELVEETQQQLRESRKELALERQTVAKLMKRLEGGGGGGHEGGGGDGDDEFVVVDSEGNAVGGASGLPSSVVSSFVRVVAALNRDRDG